MAAAIAVLLLSLAIGGGLASRRGGGIEAEARWLYGELRCPVCRGQSVAESNSAEAERMRGEIRDMLAAGKSRQEILDWYVSRYGAWILNRPPFGGLYALAWAAPALALGAAGWLLARHLRRSSTGRERAPAAASGAPPTPAGGDDAGSPADPDVESRLREWL